MNNKILIYKIDDEIKLEVNMEDETVWLTQKQMVELFQTTKQNISLHINNVFNEDELEENSVVKDFLTTANDGKKYKTKYYNLDVIISVGYRVKSLRGTQFRIWATKLLKEYTIKGFALDDERLKNLGGGVYFEQLLDRIRDIRSSEKVFWRKVLDIYATSIDYEPSTEKSREFFSQIQNKMHWAVHGNTAAEVIYKRADSKEPFMGLMTWSGTKVKSKDVIVAKNYLKEEEIYVLDRLVSAYLDFAEIQAIEKKPMKMSDWIRKLDDFIKLSERKILTHNGKISSEEAFKKAKNEYHEYQQKELTQGERDYYEYLVSLTETTNNLKKDNKQ